MDASGLPLPADSLNYGGPSLAGASAGALSSRFICQRLDTNLGDGSTCVFCFPSNGGWLELSSLLIRADIAIQKDHKDMNKNSNDNIFLAPGGHTALFEKCTVTLGETVCSVEPDFAMHAALMEKLSSSSDQRKNQLEKLSASSVNVGPQSSKVKHAAPINNYKPLVNAAKGSTVQTVWFRLGSSFTRTLRQLVPEGLPVSIALTRGSDASVLAIPDAGANDHYNLNIHSLTAYVRAHRFNEETKTRIMAAMGPSPELRFRRTDVILRSVPSGSLNVTFSNLLHNQAQPDSLLVALVSQESLYGNVETLPGFFETANLTSVEVTSAGRSVSVVPLDGLSFDYDNNGKVNGGSSSFQNAYLQLCVAGGFLERGCPIDHGDFVLGNCIFYFSLPTSHSGGQTFDPLDLRLSFAQTTENPFTLVIWAIRNAALQFHPSASTISLLS